MKKALVLAAILSLATFGAFAGLSGEFAATITIDPLACAPCYTPDSLSLLTLGASLEVEYALDDWTFGTVATFDDGGFSNMKFSVAGVLGAFTLASNMTFDPMAVTVYTYPEVSQTPDCGMWCAEATTWAPMFLKWDVTAGVSIAGVTFEAYVLQDYSHYDVEYVNYAWHEGDFAQTTSYSCTSKANGMGWRLMVAGSFGAVDVTSYTYFNLTEADAREIHCPALGKRGVFTVGEGCGFPFTEEYLLIEGFTFGCATVDVGLKILCTGFDSIEFLISDISIGGWMTMDFKLGFTTDTKSYDFCISLDALMVDCFIVELGFGAGAYVEGSTGDAGIIDTIQVNGIGYEYTWNGISFKSYTEFDVASDLISPESGVSGAESWSYVNGCTYASLPIPFVGGNCGVCVDCEEVCCTPVYDYACVDVQEGYWELSCYVLDRYKVWEEFIIDVDADACCGGLFDLTFTTLFGDYEELDYVVYNVWNTSLEDYEGEVAAYGVVPTGDDAIEWDGYAGDDAPDDGCDITDVASAYTAGDQTTLFNWAKTAVDLGVGIGSNVTLTLGFDISAFGWEALEFGFEWVF